MVGNRPENSATTTINAPIVPVIVDLRNVDGTPRFVNGHPLVYDPTQFVQLVLDSPVFQNASFDSSPVPTQITDAVMRAEFYHQAKSDWHTLLAPVVKQTQRMVLNRGTYQFALNPDGTCCRYILVDANAFVAALFPAFLGDTTTVIGRSQANGDITTKDLSTFLFPNTFLFDSGGCCILGFHSFDFEPGNGGPDLAFVMNYSSWISPGIFAPGTFQDITAVSHEIAETFNDPLVSADGVNNITPWWLAPNGLCQNNLETGDVIEGLANMSFPMTMNGFTYHPQNEALLSYFAFEIPSSAIHGAYSYPNTAVLGGPSAPQKLNCAP